jgi:hypothetical protein
MPDVWTTVPELDPSMQERLAGVLETRGADPQQLQRFYGTDDATFTGTTRGGVTPQFTSFSQVRDDIVEARIWPGIHFRFADEEAAKIGRKVAHWGNRHAFR